MTNTEKKTMEENFEGLVRTIAQMQNDIENLKLKAFEPKKEEAIIFLDYLSWDKNSNPKKNFETLYAKDLEILHEWLKIYTKAHSCSNKEALENIVHQ